MLRYLATRELASLSPAGGVDPRPALRAALVDGDPRVRETAALALGQRGDRDATAALVSGAKQEPWPFVRRAELEALGRLCVDGSGDLLIRAVERDVDQVRRAALIGLGRCKDPRGRAVFLLRPRLHGVPLRLVQRADVTGVALHEHRPDRLPPLIGRIDCST